VRTVVFAAVLFCVTALFSFGGASKEEAEIQELYARGLKGDVAAVVQCIAKLEAALAKEPQNQLARVYLGSAYTLRSRDLGFGPQKLQTLRRGVAVMDEAVAAAPDDAKVRLARALTTQSLPFFAGRAESARRDFTELAVMAERAPEKSEAGDLQIIFYNAALVAKKAGDRSRAAALFERARRSRVDAALAAKVDAELANLK
jgi:tetratricopeptide (TPR) repeat protein